MSQLAELLEATSRLHHHLCPRQVLGVRMGMLAGEVLDLDLPQSDKRLFTIAETDGCGVDGISAATNCWVGRRTLRIEDCGKLAVTFVDTHTQRAIRIVPRRLARETACHYVSGARNKWEAQLLGYQRMPAAELLSVQVVQLTIPLEAIISRAGLRAVCEICGEEISNRREVVHDGVTRCRTCANGGYYNIVADFAPRSITLAELVGPVG